LKEEGGSRANGKRPGFAWIRRYASPLGIGFMSREMVRETEASDMDTRSIAMQDE